MINRHRGEVNAELDGKNWTLCLTLGALAQLESHFDVTDLGALAEMLSSKSLCATDFSAIIYAGLKGGGHIVEAEDVLDMHIKSGAAGYAILVADLLHATFSSEDEQPMHGSHEVVNDKV